MAKKMLSGGYDLAGTKKRKPKRKRGKTFNPTKMGLKRATEKACLKGKRKLKKGCVWGRGKFKGKLFKKAA